jgi:monooxygenase
LPKHTSATRPALDFGAGYVQRALPELPRQGEQAPWQMPMDYVLDQRTLRDGDVADPHLTFSVATRRVTAEPRFASVAP